MYGFSEFACGLNEPEEGMAPTDSRLRPDQRIMENGDFDTANNEKVLKNIAPQARALFSLFLHNMTVPELSYFVVVCKGTHISIFRIS